MRCSLYIAKLRKNSEKTASFRKKFCLEMGVKPFLTDAVWRVQSGDLSRLRPVVCEGASGGKDRQSKRVIGAEVAQVAHLLTLDI